MGEGVHACADGEVARHADGQFRIADHIDRHHLRMEDHLLGMGFGIGDDARAPHFGPRARRGRHGEGVLNFSRVLLQKLGARKNGLAFRTHVLENLQECVL